MASNKKAKPAAEVPAADPAVPAAAAAVAAPPATAKAAAKVAAPRRPSPRAKAVDEKVRAAQAALAESLAKAKAQAEKSVQARAEGEKAATAKAPVDKAGKAAKARKPKLVRDSFTMPEAEYAQLAALKKRLAGNGVAVKKSELLRAGVALLAALKDAELSAALAKVDKIKTGRPAKSGK